MKDGLFMKYFVLKPSYTTAYGRASIEAIRTYASEIERENQRLADDLRDWVEQMDAAREAGEGVE